MKKKLRRKCGRKKWKILVWFLRYCGYNGKKWKLKKAQLVRACSETDKDEEEAYYYAIITTLRHCTSNLSLTLLKCLTVREIRKMQIDA